MSIRNIARDLYKTQQKIESLEKRITGKQGTEEETLHDELRLARHELAMMRSMLEGKKRREIK